MAKKKLTLEEKHQKALKRQQRFQRMTKPKIKESKEQKKKAASVPVTEKGKKPRRRPHPFVRAALKVARRIRGIP